MVPRGMRRFALGLVLAGVVTLPRVARADRGDVALSVEAGLRIALMGGVQGSRQPIPPHDGDA